MISVLEFPVGWSVRDGNRELEFIDREQEITLGFLERLAEGLFDVGYEAAEDQYNSGHADGYREGRSDGYDEGQDDCPEEAID